MLTERINRLRDNGQLPRFIAVEGPIGAGKTTLAQRLADTFGFDTLFERADDNPFLTRFYQDPARFALQTELFFLFQRADQLRELRQQDLFSGPRVADFLVDKNRLFAEVNLDEDEFALYDNVYQHMLIDAPAPDLVIYLQAPTPVLRQRVLKRGNAFEQRIDPDYLDRLNDAYTRFFHFYDRAPLLIVNAAEIDLASGDADYQQLVAELLDIRTGRHYFNPRPLV